MSNVQGCNEYSDLLEVLALVVVLAEARHGPLQGLPGHTLACTSLAHDHVTVTRHLTVKDLNDLGDKLWHHLQAA